MPLPRNRIAGALISVLIIALSATKALGQSVTDLLRQNLREAAKDSKLGSGLQSLSIFSVTPGVSAAIYNPDHDTPGTDLRIETFKIPLSYDFAPIIAGIQPYSELTLSYVHADEEDSVDLQPGQQTTLDSDFDAYSVLTGLGATIPVVRYVHVRPILLAGYSRTNVDTKFKGPFAEELKEASSGLITDAKINTMLLGGAVQARFERRLNNAIQLATIIRYDHFYARNFYASDSVLETTDNFGVLTSEAEVSGPTPLTLFGRGTRWITFVGNTYLPSEQGNSQSGIGFDNFFEVGGGAALIDQDIVDGIAGLSLRGSMIIGQDVKGWSAGLALEF